MPSWKSKVDSSQNGALGPVTTEMSHTVSSTNTTPNSSGSRAGLFRTPISGGVQSATFVPGLPPPALVVRNLMEQRSLSILLWRRLDFGTRQQSQSTRRAKREGVLKITTPPCTTAHRHCDRF